jgi:uncharacterized Rmd1/YagE family protein
MQLNQIRTQIWAKLLNLRNLDYFINGSKFDTAFTDATNEEKEKIIALINDDKLPELKKLVSKLLNKNLEDKNLHELRILARILGIHLYSKYSKHQLFLILKERLSSNDESQSVGTDRRNENNIP